MLPLEKLCLDLIVQKFERFYFALNVSKDDNLQRNFDFLQRRFSARLAKTLYEAHKLKEEYLEFLINEHLNYLKDLWLMNSAYEYSRNNVFPRLPNLKEVDLCCSDDTILESLTKFCPKLTEINIFAGRNVTDNGIKHLCMAKNGVIPCPELKNLEIRRTYTQITDVGVECLIRNLPSLERIKTEEFPQLLYSTHVKHLRDFKTVKSYNLVELDFLPTEFDRLPNRTDILKTCLTVCPKLKSLSCFILNKEELTLVTNSNLKKLNLVFPITYPNININFFLKLKTYNITSLKLTRCSMSISALGLHFPVLEKFYGERVTFSNDDDDDDDDLKLKFSSLSKCYFTCIEASSHKAICLFLLSSPKLESVTFYDCMLSLELKSRILLWGKNPCAKIISLLAIDIASEMKFIEDILLNCPSLKKMLLRPPMLGMRLYDGPFLDNERGKLGEKLRNLVECLPNKPQVYF